MRETRGRGGAEAAQAGGSVCRSKDEGVREVCEKGSGRRLCPEPGPGRVWGRAEKSPRKALGAPAWSPFEGLAEISGLVVSVVPGRAWGIAGRHEW